MLTDPLRKLALCCSLAVLVCSCYPREINLQWNPFWRIDTPYELSFDPDRIGGTDWVAEADGKKLNTEYFFDGTFHRLRFSVPDGTTEMSLVKGDNHKVDQDTISNLYADFSKTGSYKVEVPGWAAGCPARMELDAENTGDMTITVKMYFKQYYEDGTMIPEEVSDGR